MTSSEYFTTVPTLSHEIDAFALEKFYDAIDIPILKPIVKKIIDNTKYVSFEEFKKQLELNVVEYYNEYKNFHIKNNRPIFIYSDAGGDVPQSDFKNKNLYKSNNWCFNFVFNKMKELASNDGISVQSIFKITDDNKRLNDDDIIIFTDDCVYSGLPLGSLINTYAVYKNRYKFYVLIPYASDNGIQRIEDRYNDAREDGEKEKRSLSYIDKVQNKRAKKSGGNKGLFFSNFVKIPYIKDYLNQDEIEKIQFYYPLGYFQEDTYLVYFNHKLANYYEVPTLVYLGVVPNKKNLDIFHSPKFKGFITNSEEIEIKPIISNCSHYIKNINPNSPECPYPPYKKGSEQLSMKGGKRILKSYK